MSLHETILQGTSKGWLVIKRIVYTIASTDPLDI